MNTERPATPQGTAMPVRSDAQRNAARVLAAARRAVAANGLDVSYHEIAREAGVGVGTVYRRYPERDQLMAVVLSDILTELIDTAHQALDCDDAWDGFSTLFSGLALRTAQNAGLSGSLDQHGGPAVAQQRHELLDLTRRVVERAQVQGRLRRDLTWQDVLRLTGAPAVQGCVLGLEPDPANGHHMVLTVLLDGLRTG
ncbi:MULTISPECIES: TetR/AcrR family transcriptional regulator [Streptomyces]|uniref:TetR/AcrR family transcriptional regulator n=1 Tax=Streptomyces TaxID=1883 RepID=UPI0004CBB64C|nr:TetR/AcrR family transcriptional regulator [Streptomyces sp. WAC08452]MBU8553861.1 TetR/AcrR family transcriptional regulator [Streptomyces sp. Osf17]MBU8560657.1 TetR/AcrR family transcriptional regulator [Streptomyces sp. Babs14]RSS30966.1 TetR/AcrR family transcriptional regulator [Streptomyces sp. WAC08452]